MKLNNSSFIESLNETDSHYFHHSNLESLKTLRDFVKNNIPEEKFDLNHWRTRKIKQGQPNDAAWTVTCYDLQYECGTTGCMLGWAATIEEFRARGLQYDLTLGEIRFMDSIGTTAGAEFFNIPKYVAIQLFMPWFYNYGFIKKNQSKRITKNDALERLEILISHVEVVQSQ